MATDISSGAVSDARCDVNSGCIVGAEARGSSTSTSTSAEGSSGREDEPEDETAGARLGEEPSLARLPSSGPATPRCSAPAAGPAGPGDMASDEEDAPPEPDSSTLVALVPADTCPQPATVPLVHQEQAPLQVSARSGISLGLASDNRDTTMGSSLLQADSSTDAGPCTKSQLLPPPSPDEAAGNASSRSPQLAEGLQCAAVAGLASPKSPDYPPRTLAAGPNSPASTLLTKSSMTYGLPVMSAWKAFAVQPKAEPKHESSSSFRQCSSIPSSQAAVVVAAAAEPMDRLLAPVDKIKEEPTEINREQPADEPKCKVESSTLSPHKSSTHSTSSSLRDKQRKEQRSSDRHHCTRCYKRSKIKRTSVGVQCQRDRRTSTASLCKSPAGGGCTAVAGIQKSNADNLKLNLQVKNSKMLDKQSDTPVYLQGLKYKDYIHVETYPNGGASVVHMYQDEIDALTSEQLEELAQEYFKVSHFIFLDNLLL